MRDLVPSGITISCTADEFQQFFEMDDNALTYPDMGVKDVFVATGNAEVAFMTMELLSGPRPGRQGEIDAIVAGRPYSIVVESGRWRMFMEVFSVGDDCPFLGSFSRQEVVPADSSTPSP